MKEETGNVEGGLWRVCAFVNNCAGAQLLANVNQFVKYCFCWGWEIFLSDFPEVRTFFFQLCLES